MKDFRKKFSAIVLTALFASMQISYASIDTGLGAGNGGAVINGTTGGFVGIDGAGTGNVDLKFNGNSHVNWDSLNVNANERLNFNAVDGANNLTILNTVNHGMSTIYGQISANSGIGKLIISNPNGMLFDGAKFTTAGDLMLTTKDLSNLRVEDLANLDTSDSKFSRIYDSNGNVVGVDIKNAVFNVNGDYSIIAPSISATSSTINAKALKMVTSNGQDYLALGTPNSNALVGVKMKAVNINGDVYITAPSGVVKIVDGGNIDGNLKVDAKGAVALNYKNNGEKLTINGDTDVKGQGSMMFLRNADVKGNLSMSNSGGFVDVGNVKVAKNATLTTTGIGDNNCYDFNHFVHVIGNTEIGGDLKIDSSQNIHIGGYDYDANKLADGKLTVGGKLDAHAHDGHIMTTIDTKADKISLKSDNLNILTDGKAVLDANEYEFSSNGYIGGLTGTDDMTVDEKIVKVMENYVYIPDKVGTPANLNIAGGNITKIETPNGASTYIASKGDVKLTGANAGLINITAPGKYIEITGNNVKADTITVGKETDKLKVDFPSRDYTLKYTNIRDAKEVTINNNDEITYDLTNGVNGYNIREPRLENTTYLVGPDAPVTPDNPTPNIPDDNENMKVLRSYEKQSVNMNQVYTPIAYAADLDEDQIDRGVRKNVDGSVTVVRAFPMVN